MLLVTLLPDEVSVVIFPTLGLRPSLIRIAVPKIDLLRINSTSTGGIVGRSPYSDLLMFIIRRFLVEVLVGWQR